MYGHNVEADFAGSALATMFMDDPGLCYPTGSHPASLSAHATYEPSRTGWPKSDGVVSLLEGALERSVAIEFKRHNEGLHGVLTAMGQAYAYLGKGYHGAAIVIPNLYPTHPDPGGYLTGTLNGIAGSAPISVFTYTQPDLSSASPFKGRLVCNRRMDVTVSPGATSSHTSTPSTQWVHMREGSTTRDGFFRFLQCAKLLSGGDAYTPSLSPQLVAAVARIAPGRDPVDYLANVADTRLLSKVWSRFWFEWVATDAVRTPWVKASDGTYSPPAATTRIEKDDGTGPSVIFEGRANGLKETLCSLLNAGTITEDDAWDYFVGGIPASVTGGQGKQGMRDRAHSYREDVDSALEHLEWIDASGLPTDAGYRYLGLCERYNGANSDAARSYVAATLLRTGRYLGFLHYLHRVSERIFSKNSLEYTETNAAGRIVFSENSYAAYLADVERAFTEELKVLRKVSGRNRPRKRTPFQAELTLLRNYDFIPQKKRLGVGIPIDWERVLAVLDVDL